MRDITTLEAMRDDGALAVRQSTGAKAMDAVAKSNIMKERGVGAETDERN